MSTVLFIDGSEGDIINLMSHLSLRTGVTTCSSTDGAKEVYTSHKLSLPDILVIEGATPTTNEPSSIEHTLDFLREMGEIGRLPERVLVLTNEYKHDGRFSEVVPAGCRLTVHRKRLILDGTVSLRELFDQ